MAVMDATEPDLTMRLVTPAAGRLPILESVVRTCACKDAELSLMFDLIDEGLDQLAASRIAFGATPSMDADPLAWKAWCRLQVRRLGQDLRARLGLREPA